MAKWTRRRVLRGMLQGSAVSVGMPLLDVFLNGNGLALADGAPIPTRFGTWFWGCGVNASRWFPEKFGENYDIKEELLPLMPFKEKLSVFSGFNCELGGKPNLNHWSGVMATLSGAAPTKGGTGGGEADAPTIDTLVSKAIGGNSRFRSLEIACTGDPGVSYSMPGRGATVNSSEVDPVKLYQRLFGQEFVDPNSAEFTPDPAVMLRKSVLSSVSEDRQALMRSLGAEDRRRMDQFFTSIRDVEQQLSTLLEKPAAAAACAIPAHPDVRELGATWEMASSNHDQLTQLMVMALACNQTRVFNVALSNAASNLRMAGSSVAFHELTHEEHVDERLGYQPESTKFIERSMGAFGRMLAKMDAIKEGDGTLLDHSLVLATSESNYAKLHSIDNLPILVAGSAGGKWRSGQHINGKGSPSSRVGLTIQQALGMSVGSWGTDAMETSNTISEVL
jgi:hypothetical protein